MLVLSRKKGERIVIDGRITVTVITVRSRQVRLGIEVAAGDAHLAQGDCGRGGDSGGCRAARQLLRWPDLDGRSHPLAAPAHSRPNYRVDLPGLPCQNHGGAEGETAAAGRK